MCQATINQGNFGRAKLAPEFADQLQPTCTTANDHDFAQHACLLSV
jgi:hypothetical protein